MSSTQITLIEANIDDMSGEWFGFVMDRLLEAGALDVTYTPIVMKKSRPGITLSVIAKPEDEDRLADMLLHESTTIGVRMMRMNRKVLARTMKTVTTPYGDIRIKCAGDRFAPEYEDCARAAKEHSVPIWQVYKAAEQSCTYEGVFENA